MVIFLHSSLHWLDLGGEGGGDPELKWQNKINYSFLEKKMVKTVPCSQKGKARLWAENLQVSSRQSSSCAGPEELGNLFCERHSLAFSHGSPGAWHA